eukprot:4228070-Karenia_brevis.AAC.1
MDRVCSQACVADWLLLPVAGDEPAQGVMPGAPSASQAEVQEDQELHSVVPLTPDPTPTIAASPF